MKGVEITLSFIGTVIRVAILIICAMVVINVGKKAYDFGFRVFTEGPVAEAPGRDIIMSVDNDEGYVDIAKKLEEKGITSDWMLFVIQGKLSEYKGSIDAGTYTLNNSMTTDEIMAVLTKSELAVDDADDTDFADELVDSYEGEYASDSQVQSGSDLVEGDLEEGETAYEGESGEIDIENMGSPEGEGSEDSAEIEITIGE